MSINQYLGQKMESGRQHLQYGNYILTSHQGKCVSCCRAVPIFARSAPWFGNIGENRNQNMNKLNDKCADCVIYDMERIKVLPLYRTFENIAKENDITTTENINSDFESFNLGDSSDSISSGGTRDFIVKEIHEFNELDGDSRFIRVTGRYKFGEEYGYNSNNENDSQEETGIFKNIKKHLNYPDNLDYLDYPNEEVPFFLPSGSFIRKKVKIEEKIKQKPDPDFDFRNYEHYAAGQFYTTTEYTPKSVAGENEEITTSFMNSILN